MGQGLDGDLHSSRITRGGVVPSWLCTHSHLWLTAGHSWRGHKWQDSSQHTGSSQCSHCGSWINRDAQSHWTWFHSLVFSLSFYLRKQIMILLVRKLLNSFVCLFLTSWSWRKRKGIHLWFHFTWFYLNLFLQVYNRKNKLVSRLLQFS
jgi:hypothetical protein